MNHKPTYINNDWIYFHRNGAVVVFLFCVVEIVAAFSNVSAVS